MLVVLRLYNHWHAIVDGLCQRVRRGGQDGKGFKWRRALRRLPALPKSGKGVRFALWRTMANGRFVFSPVRCHSKYASAGTRQRRFLSAEREAGLEATSSARALMVFRPIRAVLAQEGCCWRIRSHNPPPEPGEGRGACLCWENAAPVVG